MSPEQATGGAEIDGRSDQYSLACVVYEMLVGEPPFTGPTAQAVIARHSLDMVSPPSIVRSTIPDAVEEAILRGLSKVPADRYATTALFAEALNTPSRATGAVRRATLAGTRGRRRPRRRALAVASVAVLVAAVAAVLGRRRVAPAAGSEGGLDPRRVAVLYFEDLSPKKDLAYLACCRRTRSPRTAIPASRATVCPEPWQSGRSCREVWRNGATATRSWSV